MEGGVEAACCLTVEIINYSNTLLQSWYIENRAADESWIRETIDAAATAHRTILQLPWCQLAYML